MGVCVCVRVCITIDMSRHQRGSPCAFHATLLYRPSLPIGLQGNIPYRHKSIVCRF